MNPMAFATVLIGIFMMMNGCEKMRIPKDAIDPSETENGAPHNENGSQEQIKIQADLEYFALNNVHFSLMVPAGFTVADFSAALNGINIIEGGNRHSLRIQTVVKNDLSHMDNAVLSPWHKDGFELVYLQDQKPVDSMVKINRTFLLPVDRYYLVLNEIAESNADISLSDAIKELADSLRIEE